MKKTKAHGEEGISLLFAMFTLLLVTAIAMGMMFMSSTETAINANFKSEETAYFAARAGLEEMRDRMLPGNPNTLAANLPTALPGGANGVLYWCSRVLHRRTSLRSRPRRILWSTTRSAMIGAQLPSAA